MADVIPLRSDRHQEALELLPWYVTGRIEPADRVKVETHLADCAQCRAELASERNLRTAVAELPLDAGLGFAALRRRLNVTRPPRHRSRVAAIVRHVARLPGTSGWMLAAQAAAVLLVVSLSLTSSDKSVPQYRTLGSAPMHVPGNMIVMFRPNTSEQDLRRILTGADARVVDGPTSAGAYMLVVPIAVRTQTLAKLRAQTEVVIAQPIDADATANPGTDRCKGCCRSASNYCPSPPRSRS